MKTVLQNIFFLCIGVALGGSIMLVMSQKASTTFVELLQMQYALDEEAAAKTACKNGDYFQAIHHLKNLMASSDQPTVKIFEEGQQLWTPMFPFTTQMLQRVKTAADPNGTGAQMINGIHHGMLAFALEKYGMREEAQRQWQTAMLLLNKTDIIEVRDFITKSMN